MAYIARRSECPTSTHVTPRRFSIEALTSPVCAPFSCGFTCWAPTAIGIRSESTIEATLRRSTKGGATTISVCSDGRFFNRTPICWPRCTASTKSRFIFQLPMTRGLTALIELNGLSRSARSPGRSPSSTSSSDAPPPVETKLTSPSRPKAWRAATESPPPTTETASDLATARATASVPAAKRSSSKTPIGPFHRIVAAPAMTSAKRLGRRRVRCRGRRSRRGCRRRRASDAPAPAFAPKGEPDGEAQGVTRDARRGRSPASARTAST